MPTKKEITHARILDAASREFRSRGYAGIGVDGIAKAAGVTSGAFYAHFGSKDGAFDAAVTKGLDEVIDAIPRFQQEHGTAWLDAFATYYLGKPHRQDLACGCAMTSLSPEIVRASPELKDAYAEKMARVVSLIVEGLDGEEPEELNDRAWSFLASLIGGLTLSRAIGDDETAETIASATKTTALKIAGLARKYS